MEAPEIAVVVPTFRRPDRALRLLDALARQTLAADRFEVIVVDDSSGDGTVETIEGRAGALPFALRVLSTERNAGPAGARNLGWRATAAPVVAFIDDDCVPEPTWLAAGLAALVADEGVGVAQGRTVAPAGAVLGDWTIAREVLGPTPYFEACNVFFRREALAATEGFDEGFGRFGEDTVAGWAVLERGWRRGFVEEATVCHDIDERGLRWRVRSGYLERHNLMAVAARFGGFRRDAFWRPWALQRDDAATTLAVVGVVAALRWRPALLLALPYLRWRRPPRGHPRPAMLMAERLVVDVAAATGAAVGAVRNGVLAV